MKVLVFGATGGTGQQLVKQSLALGCATSVFVRGDPGKLGAVAGRVTVYKGDVRDAAAVDKAINDQDVVLVALGVIPGRTQHILSTGTANIISSMEKHGVKKLVVETGAGLAENQNLIPFLWRFMANVPPMRGMFSDKYTQEQHIIKSKLDWVIVRPATLTNGPRTAHYQASEKLKMHLTSTISRADAADFMLKQVSSNKWVRKAVLLAGKH